jgi:hypothetical protein
LTHKPTSPIGNRAYRPTINVKYIIHLSNELNLYWFKKKELFDPNIKTTKEEKITISFEYLMKFNRTILSLVLKTSS